MSKLTRVSMSLSPIDIKHTECLKELLKANNKASVVGIALSVLASLIHHQRKGDKLVIETVDGRTIKYTLVDSYREEI